jgi:hypothetical protein
MTQQLEQVTAEITLIGSRWWMRFTSYRTSIFAQLQYPSPVHFKLPSGLRRMSTKTIAVLDEDQLHDGQM